MRGAVNTSPHNANVRSVRGSLKPQPPGPVRRRSRTAAARIAGGIAPGATDRVSRALPAPRSPSIALLRAFVAVRSMVLPSS